MVDVDHLKNFNNSLEHPSSDSLLKQISSVLKKTERCHDVVARYGGEEFSILLPEVSGQSALAFSERLRKVVIEHPFETGKSSLIKRELAYLIGGSEARFRVNLTHDKQLTEAVKYLQDANKLLALSQLSK